MRVRDFVVNISQTFETRPNYDRTKDFEINKESNRAVLDLLFLCEWIAKSSNADVPACKETLYPFIDLLAERFARLNKELPQAHYTTSVQTDANWLYLELAKALAACIHKGAQRHKPLEFLLPNVQIDAATAVQFLQCPQHFALNENATELNKVVYSTENVNTIPLTCKDLDTLISTLGLLPYASRLSYLNRFTLSTLSELLLNGKRLNEALNERERFVGDEEHARNTLMVFAQYYKELTRTRAGVFNHLSGSWTGYDKAIKLKGIGLVLTFLASGESLSKFEDYLNSDVFKEVVASSMLNSYTLKDAVLQGDSGELCKKIMFVSKPENRKPQLPQPSQSWFGFGK